MIDPVCAATDTTVFVLFFKAEHHRQVGSIHLSRESAEAWLARGGDGDYIESWGTWDLRQIDREPRP